MLSAENDSRESVRYTYLVNGALNRYDWVDLLK
jgi:hypothetical protein